MLKTTIDDQGVLHMQIDGKIDAPEMQRGLDEFFAIAGETGDLRVIFTSHDISLPTLGAYAVEMRHLWPLMKLVPRMKSVALVSEQAWVRNAAKIESALIPGFSLAVFAPDEIARARAHVGLA